MYLLIHLSTQTFTFFFQKRQIINVNMLLWIDAVSLVHFFCFVLFLFSVGAL